MTKCNITKGKPVFVVPVQQWGLVMGRMIHSDGVTVRFENGNTNVYNDDDLSSTEVLSTKSVEYVDADGTAVTIGRGYIDHQLMFWIDTEHESLTIAVDNWDGFGAQLMTLFNQEKF